MNAIFLYTGEILSLLSAVFWALAVVFFKRVGEKIHPIGVNLFKNCLGAIFLAITLLVLGEPLLYPIGGIFTNEDYLRMIASGIIGMGIADIIFLHSLNIIGAGITALVDTVYSPFVIFFAYIFLGEHLSPIQFAGGGIIIGAIIYASLKLQNIPVSRKRLEYGIILGVIAIAMMAFGIVLIKPVLDKFQGDFNKLLWIAGFRLVPGSLIPLFIFLFINRKQNLTTAFRDRSVWAPLIGGSILATYLGISCWILGMSLIQASNASILNQTATIFILIFARIFLKEPLTKRRLTVIGFALLGVYLVFIG